MRIARAIEHCVINQQYISANEINLLKSYVDLMKLIYTSGCCSGKEPYLKEFSFSSPQEECQSDKSYMRDWWHLRIIELSAVTSKIQSENLKPSLQLMATVGQLVLQLCQDQDMYIHEEENGDGKIDDDGGDAVDTHPAPVDYNQSRVILDGDATNATVFSTRQREVEDALSFTSAARDSTPINRSDLVLPLSGDAISSTRYGASTRGSKIPGDTTHTRLDGTSCSSSSKTCFTTKIKLEPGVNAAKFSGVDHTDVPTATTSTSAIISKSTFTAGPPGVDTDQQVGAKRSREEAIDATGILSGCLEGMRRSVCQRSPNIYASPRTSHASQSFHSNSHALESFHSGGFSYAGGDCGTSTTAKTSITSSTTTASASAIYNNAMAQNRVDTQAQSGTKQAQTRQVNYSEQLPFKQSRAPMKAELNRKRPIFGELFTAEEDECIRSSVRDWCAKHGCTEERLKRGLWSQLGEKMKRGHEALRDRWEVLRIAAVAAAPIDSGPATAGAASSSAASKTPGTITPPLPPHIASMPALQSRLLGPPSSATETAARNARNAVAGSSCVGTVAAADGNSGAVSIMPATSMAPVVGVVSCEGRGPTKVGSEQSTVGRCAQDSIGTPTSICAPAFTPAPAAAAPTSARTDNHHTYHRILPPQHNVIGNGFSEAQLSVYRAPSSSIHLSGILTGKEQLQQQTTKQGRLQLVSTSHSAFGNSQAREMKHGRGTGLRPEQGLGLGQGRGPGQGQGRGTGSRPEQGLGLGQGRGPGQGQGRGTGSRPEQGLGLGQGRGPGQGQGRGTGSRPEQGLGLGQGRGPGQGQGRGTGSRPEQGLGLGQGRGPGQGQGRGTGSRPEQGLGLGQGRGPGQGQGRGTGSRPEQGLGQGAKYCQQDDELSEADFGAGRDSSSPCDMGYFGDSPAVSSATPATYAAAAPAAATHRSAGIEALAADSGEEKSGIDRSGASEESQARDESVSDDTASPHYTPGGNSMWRHYFSKCE